jgi:hypothetical protein
MYRINTKARFSSKDFQRSGSGMGFYTISGEQDPGMNGQSISLRFFPDGQGGEIVGLRIHLNIAGNGKRTKEISSVSAYESPGVLGSIKGEAYLSTGDDGNLVQSIGLRAECESSSFFLLGS